jgi:hypothetical protein
LIAKRSKIQSVLIFFDRGQALSGDAKIIEEDMSDQALRIQFQNPTKWFRFRKESRIESSEEPTDD